MHSGKSTERKLLGSWMGVSHIQLLSYVLDNFTENLLDFMKAVILWAVINKCEAITDGWHAVSGTIWAFQGNESYFVMEWKT